MTEAPFLDTGWESTEPFDLLTLINTKKLILDTTLEEGMYTQIRLTVTEGWIVIDEQRYDMTVYNPMVQIPLVFNVLKDSSIEVVLDFEADQSVDVVRTGQNAEYLLKPVIRVENISY